VGRDRKCIYSGQDDGTFLQHFEGKRYRILVQMPLSVRRECVYILLNSKGYRKSQL